MHSLRHCWLSVGTVWSVDTTLYVGNGPRINPIGDHYPDMIAAPDALNGLVIRARQTSLDACNQSASTAVPIPEPRLH
jgi:hypothetical protein